MTRTCRQCARYTPAWDSDACSPCINDPTKPNWKLRPQNVATFDPNDTRSCISRGDYYSWKEECEEARKEPCPKLP